MNKKGTLGKVSKRFGVVIETVTGWVGAGPCYPKGLPRGIFHIYATFSFQCFNDKTSDMNTARLSAVIAVKICKGYVLRVVL